VRLTKKGRKRLLLLCLGCVAIMVLGVGAFAAREWYRDGKARAALDRGMAAYEDGRYRDALPDLGRYFSRYRDDVDAILALADARSKVPEDDGRHLSSARRLYQIALEHEPNNIEAMDALLDLYAHLGMRIEAIDTADRLLRLDENHVDALELKAAAHRAAGEYSTALDAAQRLCEIEPARYAYRQLHLVLLDDLDTPAEEILQVCDDLIESNPVGDGRWRVLKAWTLLRQGQYDAAKAELVAAASEGVERTLFPELVSLLDASGQRDAVRELIASTLESYPDEAWIHEFIVRREWRSGRNAEAFAALETALDTVEAASPGLLRWKAMLLAVRGDVDGARAAAEALAKSNPDTERGELDLNRAWGAAVKARLDLAASQPREAIEAYREALSMLVNADIDRDDAAELHLLLGEALLDLGEAERARRAFREAYEASDGRWVTAGTALVQATLRAGRPAEALETAHDLVGRTTPEVLPPWLQLAEAWLSTVEANVAVPGRVQRKFGGLNVYVDWVYENSGENQAVLPALIQARILADREGEARGLLAEAASRDDLIDSIRIRLAAIALDLDAALARSILPASFEPERPGAALQWATVNARILDAEGRPDAGLALFDTLRERFPDVTPTDVTLAKLRYCIATAHPAAGEVQEALLAREELGAEALAYVLSIESNWEDATIVGPVIDRLEETVGHGSTRWLLARANFVRRFRKGDDKAIASVMSDLVAYLQEAPDSLPTLTNLAGLALAQSEPDRAKAAAYLQRAVDRYPNQLSLYPNLIGLLQSRGDISTADRYLQQLSRRQALSGDLARKRSYLLMAQGDFEAAVASLETVVDDAATEIDRLLLAGWSLRAGDWARTEEIIAKLLENPSPSALTVQFAARVHALQGRFDEAEALLRETPFDNAEELRDMLLGAYHHSQGNLKLAGELLERAAREQPDNPTALLWLGRHYLALGEHDRVFEVAKQGLKIEPDNQELRLLAAAANLAADEASRRRALEEFRALEGDNEALIDTLEFFSDVVNSDGTFSSREQDLTRARELVREHPTFLPMWRLAYLIHLRADRTLAALALAQDAAARMPNHPEPVQWETELLTQQQRLEEARRAAMEWRRRSMDDPLRASTYLAAIELDLNRRDEARRTLEPLSERIEAGSEKFKEAFNLWLTTLMMTGDVPRAFDLVEEEMRRANVEEEDEDDRFDWWLSTCRLLPPRPTRYEALSIVERIAAAQPDRQLNLALVWLELAKKTDDPDLLDRARATAETVLATEDADQAKRVLAMIAAGRGDTVRAIALYEELIASYPEDHISRNNIAVLLAEIPDRREEALRYVDEAIAIKPQAASYVDTRATVLLALGRLEEAEAAARQAVEMSDGDAPGLLVTLARIQFARGETDAATQTLQRIDDLVEPGPSTPAELEQQIEALRGVLLAAS